MTTKVFGAGSSAFVSAIKTSLDKRIAFELSDNYSLEKFRSFASLRANQLRISGARSIAVADIGEEFNRLFAELIDPSL